MSAQKGQRLLQICSLVQQQKLQWCGLQWAAMFPLNSSRAKEVASCCSSREWLGFRSVVFFICAGGIGKGRLEITLTPCACVRWRRFVSSRSWLVAGWSLPASARKPMSESGWCLESSLCRAQAFRLLLRSLQVLGQFS